MQKLRYINAKDLNSSWKQVNGNWGHSLHQICSRTGSFPPYLPHYFIQKYSKKGDRILDIFSGKGTTCLEACLNQRIGIGNDLSPDAFCITKAKTDIIKKKEVIEKLYILKKRITNELINFKFSDFDDLQKDFIQNRSYLETLKIFFHETTLKQILILRSLLNYENKSKLNNFLKANILGIIHGSSKFSLSISMSHSYSQSPNYIEKYAQKYKLKKPNRNVINCLKTKIIKVLKDGINLTIGEAYKADAPKLDIEPVDMIFTSPPYFNKQTYAWDNWLRLWFLGYDFREIRKKLTITGSKIKYKQFMKHTINNCYKLLKENCPCFLVIGDVKLNGIYINSAKLIAEIGEDNGFSVYRIINDDLKLKKRYLSYIPVNQGVKLDRIVEFHKGIVNRINSKKVHIEYKIPRLISIY